MIELITPFVTALSVTIPILSLIWIWRHSTKLGTPNGLFSIVIIAFAGFHFGATGHHYQMINELSCGLFYILTACMNVFCSTYTNVNVGVNRRKEQRTEYDAMEDRRKIDPHTLVKNKVPR